MFKQLVATKPVQPAGHVDAGEPFEGSLEGEPTLKRTLTGTQLILLGIGAVIGAGIFVLTGQAAAEYAGPAVMLSFVFAGIRSEEHTSELQSLMRISYAVFCL